MADPTPYTNGVTITKSQVAFWTQVIISMATVAAVWLGASRPAQPQTSAENQQQILANQDFVMHQVGKVDKIAETQQIILEKLEALEKKLK